MAGEIPEAKPHPALGAPQLREHVRAVDLCLVDLELSAAALCNEPFHRRGGKTEPELLNESGLGHFLVLHPAAHAPDLCLKLEQC
eukprot:6110632-Lingulodinium_polyedra.AAC.1